MIDKVARNDKEKEKLLIDHILTIKEVNIDINEFYSTVKVLYMRYCSTFILPRKVDQVKKELVFSLILCFLTDLAVF
jgi:hypothetical protein